MRSDPRFGRSLHADTTDGSIHSKPGFKIMSAPAARLAASSVAERGGLPILVRSKAQRRRVLAILRLACSVLIKGKRRRIGALGRGAAVAATLAAMGLTWSDVAMAGNPAPSVSNNSMNYGAPAANGADSLAVGDGATTGDPGATAIGENSTASGSGGGETALGTNANASGNSATAIGANSTTANSGATAVGTGTTASGANSFAGGLNATSSGTEAIAIGQNTQANGTGSVAIGG